MRYLFFDRISSIKKGEYIKGCKVISFEESHMYRETGTKVGELPSTLLIEALNQSIMWFVLYTTDFKSIPLPQEVSQLQIHGEMKIGKKLDIEVRMKSIDENCAIFDAYGYDNDKIIIESRDMIFALEGIEKYLDATDCESVFKNLTIGAEVL